MAASATEALPFLAAALLDPAPELLLFLAAAFFGAMANGEELWNGILIWGRDWKLAARGLLEKLMGRLGGERKKERLDSARRQA